MKRHAACLDDEAGLIVGYVSGDPGRARISLDDVEICTVIATAPVETLSDAVIARIGWPPTAVSAFAARLPANVSGARLDVVARGAHDGSDEEVFSHNFASVAELARYKERTVMTDVVRIESVRLQGGVFHALVRSDGAASPPEVELRLRERVVVVAKVEPTNEPGRFTLTAPVPADVFGEGVATIEFALPDGGVAARYPIAAGAVLAGDLASEVSSLRVEVDQMKRAIRGALAGGVIRRDERAMIVAEALAQVDNLLEARDRADRAHQRAEATEWEDEASLWEIDE